MSDQITSYDSVQGQGQPSTLKLCLRHGNKEFIYLFTDPARTDDLIFKCEFCVVEQTLQSKYLLPISQLATSNLKTVFWHWPLPDNSELLEKVRALSIREKPDAAYKQKIDSFFKEMRIEVMARIDVVQAALNKHSQTLWDFDHTILEQYSQLSEKEALKSAVLDSSEELQQLSTRIRRTVTGVLSNTEVAAASLASSLDQLALQESAVDFTGPLKIKEEVLASISKISMFLVEDMQDLQMQPGLLREMEAEAEGNLDVVLKLASCRFNDLSEGFRERINSQLQKFRRVFDKIELGNAREEGKRVAEFDSLGEEEVREVKAFAERLIESKKQRERGDNGNKLNTKSLSAEKVIELVKNETNFCSEEYINSLQAALKGVHHYLESFQLAERENNGLEREQLSSLGKLGSKIKDLNARYGENYKGRVSPNQEEQPKSVSVSEWLREYIGENGVKEVSNLLCKLPIFELTDSQWIQHTCIQWKWMKTGWEQSSSLQLQNENNGVRVIQTQKCDSQAVTESTLDNSLVYSVKCTFNKPLNGVRHVTVGLIPENEINNNFFGQSQYHNHGFWSTSGFGLTKIIKGQLLNSAALNTTLTTIFIRFCIQTQTFMVADPTLQNISMLDKDKINPNTKYRFAIRFDGGDGYSFLFSNVMSSFDQTTADKF